MTSQEIIDVHAVQTEMAGKLADARERLSAATAAADQVAFSAHSGDKAAIAALAKHNAEAATASAEARSLEAALAEAQRRVAAAEAKAQDDRERDRAREALELVEQFEKRAESLDAALRDFVEHYNALEADWRTLAALGYHPTASFELTRVGVSLAAQTALQRARLEGRFLAPHERRSFGEVIGAWSDAIRNRAEARINRNKPRKAA